MGTGQLMRERKTGFRLLWLIGLLELCLACATLPVEGEFFSDHACSRVATSKEEGQLAHGRHPGVAQ
jgi:hypothetical protein